MTAAAMDRARAELNADKAIAEFKVTGKGVLVAIMDRGIDWQNDDFRNADGSTRIKWIFDLTDDSGANQNSNRYRVGTVYSEQQINAALRGGRKLPTRDAIGHGTTTTGIACGSGRNSPGRKYRGLAPEASIICVKICSDGATAHDGEPAEAAFYDHGRVFVAIDFIRDKAKELGMPCVMVLNIGTQGGPTDGTSDLCRKIDDTVGPEKPGLIFVTGPGDDGGRANRAGGRLRQGQKLALKIRKESQTPVVVDLWYPGEDRLDVAVETPGGKRGPFPPPVADDESVNKTFDHFDLQHNSGGARFYDPQNTKRQIWLNLKGPPGDYALVLHGKVIKQGRFDATINPNSPSPVQPPFNRFLNYLAPGSIWDGATARHNICPGDYVIRTETDALDGQHYARNNEGLIGELWKGSSTGPTFDGRPGVDFCVPADIVFTTYNPKSAWAQAKWNLARDGRGLYGNASAVSAANPMAAGVIALMLELDPQLDAVTAKTLLQKSARSDRFTGKTPNPAWGHGKLDVFTALKLTRQNADKRRRGSRK